MPVVVLNKVNIDKKKKLMHEEDKDSHHRMGESSGVLGFNYKKELLRNTMYGMKHYDRKEIRDNFYKRRGSHSPSDASSLHRGSEGRVKSPEYKARVKSSEKGETVPKLILCLSENGEERKYKCVKNSSDDDSSEEDRSSKSYKKSRDDDDNHSYHSYNSSQQTKYKCSECPNMQSGYANVYNNYVGKPTAHVEPYVSDPSIKNHQNKSEDKYENMPLIDFVNENASTDKHSIKNRYKYNIETKTTNKTDNPLPSTSKSSSNLPSDKTYKQHYKKHIIQETKYLDNLKYKSEERRKSSGSVDMVKIDQNDSKNIQEDLVKKRKFRSMSLDSASNINARPSSLRYSKSLPQLLETSGKEDSNNRHNNEKEHCIVSEECSDSELSDDQQPLQVVMSRESSPVRDKETSTDKDSKRKKYNRKSSKYITKKSQTDEKSSNNENIKGTPRKKRKEKRKEKLDEDSPLSDELLQEYNEQEKGKRLALELPHFNWLEQKIKKSDPSTTNPSADEDLSIVDVKLKKPIPALIPKSEFASINKDSEASKNTESKKSSRSRSDSGKLPQKDSLKSTNTIPIREAKPCYSELEFKERNPTPDHDRHKENDKSFDMSEVKDTEKKAKDVKSISNKKESQKIKDSQDKNMGYTKRHIQATVPPLIPSNKVQSLNKAKTPEVSSPTSNSSENKRESTPVSSRVENENSSSQSNEIYRSSKSPMQPENRKLSLLAEAFKSKCIEKTPKPDDDVEITDKNIPPNGDIERSSSRCSTIHECNSPNVKENSDSQSSSSENNQGDVKQEDSLLASDKLLQALESGDSSTVTSPLIISSLIYELKKTREEVEKLRRVQEQMLNERFSQESSANKDYSKSTVELDIEENSKESVDSQEEGNKARKRKLSLSNEPGKKHKSSSPIPENPNTITIRYTLPSASTVAPTSSTGNYKNMLGINNSELDVVPINKMPYRTADPQLARNIVYCKDSPVIRHAEHVNQSELYQHLTKPRQSLPELPNLIPSSESLNLLKSTTNDRTTSLIRIPQEYSPTDIPSSRPSPDHRHVSTTYSCESRIPTKPPSAPYSTHPSQTSSQYPFIKAPLMVQYDQTEREKQYAYNSASKDVPEKPIYTKHPEQSPQTFHPKILIHSENKPQKTKEWALPPPYANSSADYNKYMRSMGEKYEQAKFAASLPQNVPYNPNSVYTKPPTTYPSPAYYHSSTQSSPYPKDRSYSPPLIKPSVPQSGYIMSQNSLHTSTYNSSMPVNMQHPASTNQLKTSSATIQNRPTPVQKATYCSQYMPPQSKNEEAYMMNKYSKMQDRESQRIAYNSSLRQIYHGVNPNSENQSTKNYKMMQPKIIQTPKETEQSSSPSSPLSRVSKDSNFKVSSKKCLICDKMAQFLCSGCKLAWYCSKECQREDWSTHSPRCSSSR